MPTAAQARAARFEAASRRRLDEARDAWDFIYRGAEAHENDCIFVQRAVSERLRSVPHPTAAQRLPTASEKKLACSRDYNPGPPPEDEKLYEGSALSVLWDTSGKPNPHAWQLAGWNLTRGAT